MIVGYSRAPAAPAFTETGVVFGTDDSLRRLANLGAADAKTMLYFASLSFTNAAGTAEYLFTQDSVSSYIRRETGGGLRIVWRDTSAGAPINFTGATATGASRYAILLALDADGTSRLHLKPGAGSWVVNDNTDTTGGGANLEFTAGSFSVGAADGVVPASFVNATHYRTAVWTGITLPALNDSTAVDAVAANFVNSDGTLKSPALSVTAYGTPRVELSGSVANYNALVNGNPALSITGGAGNFDSKNGTFT